MHAANLILPLFVRDSQLVNLIPGLILNFMPDERTGQECRLGCTPTVHQADITEETLNITFVMYLGYLAPLYVLHVTYTCKDQHSPNVYLSFKLVKGDLLQ